ncbi:MAG: hypothetical protein LAP13_15335 [Acidobacteriia bacterium]|nr:hypothetical protein [Terriglobia bacterium]
MKRRTFLKHAATLPALGATLSEVSGAKPRAEEKLPRGRYKPGRIPNEYNLFLPGEREALATAPRVTAFGNATVTVRLGTETKTLKAGESLGGWQLVAILPWLNGVATAVFEKHVTHQGAIVYATELGEIARIPKRIGDLSKIRPRPTNTPHGVKFERPMRYVPGPDVAGDYILHSDEDPCYENVAALGAELIGWTLVANGDTGPQKALWLEADGKSREFGTDPQSLWAPDLTGRQFDPRRFLPSEYWYEYVPGYSKRTLLGGYLPAADIGVWNPKFQVGYEVMVVLPPGAEAKPLGRLRSLLPASAPGTLIPAGDTGAAAPRPAAGFVERYWNGSAEDFFAALAGIWNKWHHFFEDRMRVEIPDAWLLDAARAGIVLARSSYRGLEPTYQIGEGAYTKIPERSHALFPVAHYEFVWGHQLWNLTEEVEPYFQNYLEKYILPDGNFLYNTQDQLEAPLNCGVFLENSARAYDYTRDIEALRKRLPVLRRMIGYVVERYRYTQRTFPPDDPRHGLIWGSPEADNGDPENDFPESHPYYYPNASWTWRGLTEHARCLAHAGKEHRDPALEREAAEIAQLAQEMRGDVERSLKKTLADRNPAMKEAGITPFTAFDTTRKPAELSSYENHRYMMDWWTSDWGDAELDAGHFRHRALAGEQIMGLNIDGDYPRTSNFMEHGTLAGRVRQEDYRPFLLALYGNLCYAMDSGSRYAPEDALLPGNYPGEGSPYAWSAVVNSELQPALGLRWLLCYEEHDRAVVHLQKAAPKHWFSPGEKIFVENCPTRFGPISWTTEALSAGDGPRWRASLRLPAEFAADLTVHIHPPNAEALKATSLGELHVDRVALSAALLAGKTQLIVDIR